MDHPTSRTDPRVQRTRRLLRDAFVELLQEMDIDKISVNRLAQRATINRVTFYLHYRDIPDMMDKMADDMVEDISSILEHAIDNPSPASAQEEESPNMVRLLEHIAEHAKFYKVVLATRRTPIFTERLLKLLTTQVAARLERRDDQVYLSKAGIQKDVAIWYGSSALIGTIVAWLRSDMPYTPRYLAKQFVLLRRHLHQPEA